MRKNKHKKMTSSESLEAIQDTASIEAESKVSIPTQRGVDEAKEWVDETEK